MKTSVLCLALAAIVSCSLFYPELPPGGPRGFQQLTPQSDTSFLVSAVSFSADFDWQKDSNYQSAPCTLLLFRNENRVLELLAGAEAGIGVSPNQHHLIDDSIFTEYTDERGTQVKKNGESVLWWEEPEKLLGLLYKDGILHSLGQSENNNALTYREDGLPVLKIEGGTACGGFGCNGYGATGALYEESGHVCFAYYTGDNISQTAVLVMDGIPETVMAVSGARVMDAKIRGREKLVLYEKLRTSILSADGVSQKIDAGVGLMWYDANLIEYDGHHAIAGRVRRKLGGLQSAIGWKDEIVFMDSGSEYIYCDGKQCPDIHELLKRNAGCYFFHRDCAVQLGRELAAVFTPQDMSESPFLEFGGKMMKYNLNGYLTGIAVEKGE